MLNHIVIMGRLTRDPELRHTQAGTPVASFAVAVDRDYKNKETGKAETDFIDCVAWRSTGEFVSKYFAKGRMAVVEGRLQLRDWQDKEGNKRRSAEVLVSSAYFGDSKPKDGDSAGGKAKAGKDDDFQLPDDFGEGSDNGFADLADDDGDLPF